MVEHHCFFAKYTLCWLLHKIAFISFFYNSFVIIIESFSQAYFGFSVSSHNKSNVPILEL